MTSLNNCLDRATFIVRVFDPIKREVVKGYICIGDIPNMKPETLKKYLNPVDWKNMQSLLSGRTKGTTGGNEDFEFNEEDLAEETPELEEIRPLTETNYHEQTGSKYELRQFPQFFPEDNFNDVKKKITILTGIPLYNQFLFWGYQTVENHTYYLTVDGSAQCFNYIKPIDPIGLFDLEVDKYIYSARDSLGFISFENFSVVNNSFPKAHNIAVIDANAYLRVIQPHAQEILNDTYLFELLYYGLIKKYFPIYQQDIMRRALIGQTEEIVEEYPKIAPDVEKLTEQYGIEQDILRRIYRVSGSEEDKEIAKQIYVSVNQVILGLLTTFGKSTSVNLRNLFDVFETSPEYPYVHTVVSPPSGGRYTLEKAYGTFDISTVSIEKLPRVFKGFLVIYSASGFYFGIDSKGDIQIFKKWYEEDLTGFEDVLTQAIMAVNPIIAQINTKREQFLTGTVGQLNLVNRKTLIFKNINSSIIWRMGISKEQFAALRREIDLWEDAGMVTKNALQTADSISFRIVKGMNKYPVGQFNASFGIQDEYVYLTNPQSFERRWYQLYGGKNITIHHRNVSVKFETHDMENMEFQMVYCYCRTLCVLMKNAGSKHQTKRKENQLKKLTELDPELYDMKKHNSRKVYSVIVQKKYRPEILTADELAGLSATERKKIYKYWNFTTKAPAYYRCPKKSLPYLNFTPSIHPLGYCLPRCTGTKPRGNKILDVYTVCMQKHAIDIEEKKNIKHIVKYGKPLTAGRFSHLPAQVKQILLEPTLLLYGIDVDYPSSLIASLG
ncbi:hypothetical protein KDA11_04010, partial [Candidatus Saccharibacteria bacterium]|nr:hypothetical protein [Candidatus Saccharibacteria bacterium]